MHPQTQHGRKCYLNIPFGSTDPRMIKAALLQHSDLVAPSALNREGEIGEKLFCSQLALTGLAFLKEEKVLS